MKELGLENRVEFTGFVPEDQIEGHYQRADLVIAPFRETTGSGSLAHALARGAAILASDLPLNREVEEREAGSLAFFKTEDASDCASRSEELLGSSNRRVGLGEAASKYAQKYGTGPTARDHIGLYKTVR